MPKSKTVSTASELLAALPGSPDVYPQKLDLIRAAVLLIGFDAPSYAASSFLDDRILGPATSGVWLSLERATAAAKASCNARPLHYVLHTGHVGSTLLSRLLDTTGTVLSLREPLPLRTLAEASDHLGLPDSLLDAGQFESLLDAFTRLWARGYPSTRSVVLKATSSAARLAPALLERDAAARAVYLNLRAEPYLATLLAGANSMLDLRGHGAERVRRLGRKLTGTAPALHALSPGELAAMSWLAESITQRDVIERAPGRVLALDFDELLSDVAGVMARVATHLDIETAPGWTTGLASSPALTRYSKAPDHDYSPALRSQLLAQSRRDNRAEILRGLDWLASLAAREPAVAQVFTADGG